MKEMTWCQFHQHSKSSFCVKKVQTKNVSTKKQHAKLLYNKDALKMLVKLTAGERESGRRKIIKRQD
jgi:hypothetical protein